MKKNWNFFFWKWFIRKKQSAEKKKHIQKELILNRTFFEWKIFWKKSFIKKKKVLKRKYKSVLNKDTMKKMLSESYLFKNK